MTTPTTNSRRIYTPENRRDPHYSGDCLTHKFFDDAQSSINDVLGLKIAEIVSTPLTFCVDQVASSTKASFCYSDSTDTSIDEIAQAAKSVSVAACYIPANTAGIIGKIYLECWRSVKGIKVETFPDKVIFYQKPGWNA